MAQRGGSVVAHLRYGKKVYSPLIEPGGADIQVAFEVLESVRYLPYLNKQSRVIVNTQHILPPSVSTGQEQYPDNVLDELTKRGLTVFPIDAFKEAKEIGELRTVNMVLVGALSRFLPVEEDMFLKVIDERVKKGFEEVNKRAFRRGRELTAE